MTQSAINDPVPHPTRFSISLLMICILGVWTTHTSAAELRVGVFDVDASPPVGSPLAYDPTQGVETPLSLRGIVILGADQPIVLCAIDWIGIGNGGQTIFRSRLASAAGTIPARVAVHALHQHDAPKCDFDTDQLLYEAGFPNEGSNPVFARQVIRRAADALRVATTSAQSVSHIGVGMAEIEKVASNRRILGPDGKVKFTRWTKTVDAAIRAMPVGTIDPKLRMVSFWNGSQPLAVLSYYATHPQSYYRTGLANPDFPGLARNARQTITGVPHIHFNGAGGNIGAGKWNDGAHKNRQILADRVASGMKQAWEQTEREPVTADDVSWQVLPVALPVAEHLHEQDLQKTLFDSEVVPAVRYAAAKSLVWLRRCQNGDTIDITCLGLNQVRILHLPGELFVEYQLAAQEISPHLFVAMAAYGDYAPGYIGTKISYRQGGYETSARASRVAPAVEEMLMKAIETLLR